MGSGLPDVSSNPVVVYAAIAVVVLLAIGTATDKGLGPLSRWFFDFARRRRVAAAEKRQDVDAAHDRERLTLQQRLERLEALYDAQLREQAKRDTLAVEHTSWDREARLTIANLGGTLREPPPLIPSDD